MTTPAGWYDDGSGRQRWWDGTQWTEHFAPVAEPDASVAQEQATADVAESDDSTAAAETQATIESITASETVSPWSQQAQATPAADAAAVPDAAVSAADAASWSTPSSAPEQSVADAGVEPAIDASPADAAYTPPVAPAQDPAPSYGAPQSYDATQPYDPVQPYAAPDATQPYAATQPYGDAAAYPGAAPAYPGAAPAYPGAGYPQAAPQYGAAYPSGAAAPSGPRPMSIVGLIGLGLAVLGTILSCIPVANAFGWILLAAGFVVSLISLFLKGKKWPGVTGLILSVVGTIIAFVMAILFLATAVSQIASDLPTAAPSSDSEYSDGTTDDGTTDDGTTDDGTTDDGTVSANRPTVDEVAAGIGAIISSTGVEGYTEEQISCFAQEFVNSDIDDDTLRTIADTDGTFTDPSAAQAFAEEFGAALPYCLS